MLKPGIGNSLNSREIEPLLFKAGSILSFYEQAADCTVQILDSEGRSIDPGKTGSERFCCCCGNGFSHCKTEDPGENSLCGAVHQNAIEESRKLGSSYIYMCPMGLVFWISPLYAGGRYTGALIAGKVLGIEKEEACARMQVSGLETEQIKKSLEQIPRRNYEEIKALAQMMLICAQRISTGKAGVENPAAEPASAPGLPDMEEAAADSAETAGEAGAGEMAVGEMAAGGMGISAPPSSNERLLIAALRRGDSIAATRILENILAVLNTICPGDLRFFRCRAIELVVFLSRSCAVGKETGALLEENNLHLKKIGESSTIEELSANLYRIIERMAGRIFSFQGLRHASALRRAERFIWKNYTRKVSLDEIAAASGLSAPYFSTIFREEMGEYLSTHLNRLRVEKACIMLIETNASLNDISESCGFEDQSWFSKIFKSYTGYSPGKYREQGGINVYSQGGNRAG
ncbi:MAG: helix-turn-helix domain-containing protein [Treponema sp.]|jgi:AraC-like DNA-binding protein/ligand-binding sensor protein|nr:helix-turn-helix domain-containing protein [Treponema sp.]